MPGDDVKNHLLVSDSCAKHAFEIPVACESVCVNLLVYLFFNSILEMQRDRVMEDYKVKWWNRNKKDCPVTQDSGGKKLKKITVCLLARKGWEVTI